MCQCRKGGSLRMEITLTRAAVSPFSDVARRSDVAVGHDKNAFHLRKVRRSRSAKLAHRLRLRQRDVLTQLRGIELGQKSTSGDRLVADFGQCKNLQRALFPLPHLGHGQALVNIELAQASRSPHDLNGEIEESSRPACQSSSTRLASVTALLRSWRWSKSKSRKRVQLSDASRVNA